MDWAVFLIADRDWRLEGTVFEGGGMLEQLGLQIWIQCAEKQGGRLSVTFSDTGEKRPIQCRCRRRERREP